MCALAACILSAVGLTLYVVKTAVPPRRTAVPAGAAARPAGAAPATRVAEVWIVEKTGNSETYSNGLRVENDFVTANHRRSYAAFPAGHAAAGAPQRRSDPAGIVFHTTESQQAPFEARQNGRLKRIQESLLEFVRRKRAYNFVVDRFGRVHRIVVETDAANHAGYSVWADDRWLYINLNESFLGVSLEAQTAAREGGARISPAQARSAAMLVEMLRGRYRFPAANCVTHAQVSVNPSNMRAGYHTDWASGFPFQELGLPDNDAEALPAVWAFGFECDSEFLNAAGARLQSGVELADNVLRQRAAAAGMHVRAYRKMLQKRYRERLAQARHQEGL